LVVSLLEARPRTGGGGGRTVGGMVGVAVDSILEAANADATAIIVSGIAGN
jgi:hypothetical protein